MDVTSYLLGKKQGGGGGTPTLQNKDVNVTSNGSQTISADSGYDGLRNVNLTTNVQPNLEEKSITITENKTTTITAEQGKDGLSSVVVTTNVSGADLSDYFNTEISNDTSVNSNAFIQLVKKFPNISVGSNVTSLQNAFQNYKGATIPEISGTSNVVNMSGMFNSANNITTIPLINTSKVTNMSGMFMYCTSLQTIPQLDTSKVTTMQNMFYFQNASALTSVPKLNASSIVNISNVFFSSTGGSQTFLNLFTDFGGFENLGQAYLTTSSANYSNYTLDLKNSFNLTHDSLMNVINNLYDIATAGCNTQKLQLGATNLAKLSSAEIAIATNKGWTVS